MLRPTSRASQSRTAALEAVGAAVNPAGILETADGDPTRRWAST